MEKHISLLKQSGSERYRSVMQMAGHERCRVFLLVEGNYCETIGRVCMDQLMIRLPQEFPVGTKVTLIGKMQTKKSLCRI